MNINEVVKLAIDFEEAIPETLRTPYSSEKTFTIPEVETIIEDDVLDLNNGLSDLEAKTDSLFYILKNIKDNINLAKSILVASTSDKEQLYLDLDTYLYNIKKSFLTFESGLKNMPEIKNKIKEIANAHVQLGQQD